TDGGDPGIATVIRGQHRALGPGRLDADHAAAQEHLAAFRPADSQPAEAAAQPSADPGTVSTPMPEARFVPRATAAASAPPPAPTRNGTGGNEGEDLLFRVLGGLALRDLTLVESLLQVVEKLESSEEDPGQLELLFRVDHLATRMRRNSENLLVLAGHDMQVRDLEPVPLLDVARAAVSEITDYGRAQITALPNVRIAGVAADDLSHILAELLENATSKSPESAPVVVRAERTGDGTMVVSVEDSGIGIPADQLAGINMRLGRTPVVDPSVTRRMGLYVVGRLAQRHGIRVQLRERPHGGITANVITPARLIMADPEAPSRITRRPSTQPQPIVAPGRPARPARAVPRSAAAPQEPPPGPAPRFSPADPSMLPRRAPGRATAVNPPAPLPAGAPRADAGDSRADQIRTELADFRLGQSEARATAPEVRHSNGFPRLGPEPGERPGPADGQPGTEAEPT
ncbi:MAG TPA: sensor histidine kinase, partial [Streptosporangiaceae bacterium]